MPEGKAKNYTRSSHFKVTVITEYSELAHCIRRHSGLYVFSWSTVVRTRTISFATAARRHYDGKFSSEYLAFIRKFGSNAPAGDMLVWGALLRSLEKAKTSLVAQPIAN